MDDLPEDFVRSVQEELIPKLESSGFIVSFYEGVTDVKYAVELGLSVLMDKPIIVLVAPGSQLPERLVRVADDIIECDLSDPIQREKLARRLVDAAERMDPDRRGS